MMVTQKGVISSVMTVKEKFTYRFLNMLARHLSRKSLSKRMRLANRLGAFAHNRIPIRRQEAFNNIKRAFSEKSDLWISNTLKSTYRTVCTNFTELLALPHSMQSFNFNIENQHVLDNALKEGKGVILITGHFGLWELWGAWLGHNGYPLWGIIQRQGNRGADRFFIEKREAYGLQQIYRKSSLDNIYKLFEENKMVILASDQDAKRKGVFVKFFGHPASTPKGTAIFHMRTGSPMVFSVCNREADGSISISFSKVEVNGDASIESITQSYTTLLEAKVREYPDHFFWFHQKWKTQLPA